MWCFGDLSVVLGHSAASLSRSIEGGMGVPPFATCPFHLVPLTAGDRAAQVTQAGSLPP